ncbi:bifunctional RNase H/acid phosphatase [Streptomyces paradoxus]|uniref:bifunctional RNase H/acid phosphatase n=1 Tax=Streptomyces paradoxus TaxID=66375 RepID=UPI0036F91098
MDAGARGERWSQSSSTAELHAAPRAAATPEPPGDAAAGAARVRGALAAGRAAAVPAGRGPDAVPASARGATSPSGSAPAPTPGTRAEADTETGEHGTDVRPAEAAADARAVRAATKGGSAGADADVRGSAAERPVAKAAGWRAATAGAAADGHDVPADAPAGRAVAGGDIAGADADARVARAGDDADARAVSVEAGVRTGGGGAVSGSAPGDADVRAAKAVGGAEAARVEAGTRAATAEAGADAPAAKTVAAPGWAPADMGAPATFVLLRHGETPLTPQKRFSGSGGTDPSLSDTGREQAERAAVMLARRGTIQAVVSSPLARTRETAGIVAARLGLDVSIDDGLRETDFGAWEGLTFAEVRERHPDDLNAWLASPDAEPTGGGESFATTATRLAATRDKLVAAHAGRTVLLVTHVTPIKTLVRLALGAPPESLFRMELSAASLSVVAYYADGNASVRLLNDTSHLR